MKVLFVSETGGEHGSYLPAFAACLAKHAEFGVRAELLMETPVAVVAQEAPSLLRRFGLDGHFSRSRRAFSARVRQQVEARRGTFDAILASGQTAALDLSSSAYPLHVCVDATFAQLGRSPWFSDLGAARRLAPSLLSELLQAERALYERATTVLPWSEAAANSLREEYGVPAEKMMRLPPSVELFPAKRNGWPAAPRGLFFAEDFKRQGGDLLVECFRRYFSGRIELDLVTQEKVRPQPGVRVFRDVQPHSAEWRMLWEEANFFIHPSRLETFGAPLLHALAFGLPIIASRSGAAEEILENGGAGILIDQLTADGVGSAIDVLLGDRKAAIARAQKGRERAELEFDLRRNAARLATVLKGPISRTTQGVRPQPQI